MTSGITRNPWVILCVTPKIHYLKSEHIHSFLFREYVLSGVATCRDFPVGGTLGRGALVFVGGALKFWADKPPPPKRKKKKKKKKKKNPHLKKVLILPAEQADKQKKEKEKKKKKEKQR